MSSEERRQILTMVEAGKISAEEALSLIKELEQDSAEAESEPYEAEAGAAPEADDPADPGGRVGLTVPSTVGGLMD